MNQQQYMYANYNMMLRFMMMNPQFSHGLMNMNFGMGINQPYTLSNVIKPEKKEKKQKIEKTISKEEQDEIDKWILRRKRNFPTKDNIDAKEKNEKLKEDAGMISKLEIKLRKKVNKLKLILSGGKRRKMKDKNSKWAKNKGNQKLKKPDENQKQIPDEDSLEEGEIEVVEKKDEKMNHKGISTESKILDQEPKDQPSVIKENIKSKKNQKKNNPNMQNHSYPFKYKQNTLYKNMIKKEVIQEKNIILQALRYFINEGLCDD